MKLYEIKMKNQNKFTFEAKDIEEATKKTRQAFEILHGPYAECWYEVSEVKGDDHSC